MSQWLMLISLIALGVFLGFWLQSSYENEKQLIQKELTYTFKDVVSEIEDSLVHQVLFANVRVKTENVFEGWKQLTTKKVDADTISIRFEAGDISEVQTKGIASKQVFIQKSSEEDISIEGGLLPMLINWEADSAQDPSKIKAYHEEVIQLITSGFDRVIQNKDLPSNYEILKLEIGESGPDISVGFYSNPKDLVFYAAHFGQFRNFALGRLMPNILFAILLFGAIATSFYLIYSNWRRQQRLVDIKNDFISNVTHELKTPISTVSVALEALSDFDVLDDKARAKEYIQISKKELSRLGILVDKVLKMSIFEKGATKFHLEELNAKALIEDVLSSMKVQFEKERAEVDLVTSGNDFKVEADKIHLTNVIYNLLDNALKYNQSKPKISLVVTDLSDAVEIQIIDNGIGINKSDQGKIFDRFYRVPTGDRHDTKGHGLGLSYVASVIEQHGGKIDLESELGKGSRFTIRLNKHHGAS